MIYDLGMARVTSTVEREYRIILVVKEQEPFKGDRRKKVKKVRYAIVENLPLRLDAFALYQFYCGRQTIENFSMICSVMIKRRKSNGQRVT